jgi:hypothetical protein
MIDEEGRVLIADDESGSAREAGEQARVAMDAFIEGFNPPETA